MNTSYYAVYDKLSDSFSRLIGSASLRALCRSLQDDIPAQHPWKKHPEDFSLFHVLDLDAHSCVSDDSPTQPKMELSSLTSIFGKEEVNE